MLEFLRKYLLCGGKQKEKYNPYNTARRGKGKSASQAAETYTCHYCNKHYTSHDLYSLHKTTYFHYFDNMNSYCPLVTGGTKGGEKKAVAPTQTQSSNFSLSLRQAQPPQRPEEQKKKEEEAPKANSTPVSISKKTTEADDKLNQSVNLQMVPRESNEIMNISVNGKLVHSSSFKLPKTVVLNETDMVYKIVIELLNLPFQKRRQRELDFINKNIGLSIGQKFIVSEKWIENYTQYLNRQRKDPPGPIDNSVVLEHMKKGNLKADTYAVNEKVWNFMKRLYGGGPEIPQGGKISSILSDTKDDAKRANSLGRIDSIKNADVLRSPDLMTRSDAPDIMRMSYSSDLMTKSTPILSSRPSGMSNEMFYCYLNATFQCIMGIKPLVEYTISGKYNAAVHKNKIPKFWKAFSEVVQMNSKGTKFTPKQIRRITTGNFDPSQQHDSHEFMRYILSGLQDEINMPRPKKIIEFKDANTAWEHYRKYNSSIIDDLFAGQLISRVTCRSCNNISYSYDPFLDISLPVIPEKTRNLDDCIGAFLKEEDIKDSYACEKCKLKNRCSKKFSIFRFPKILALHLKRFQTFPKKRKISANVDFPLDKLKIKKQQNQIILKLRFNENDYHFYSLIGIVIHIGGVESGHYVACSKRGEDWFYCDDESVKKISPKEVTSKEAYVLVYEKQI